MLENLTVGIILSSLMGFGGYYKQSLSESGVVGAIVVGTSIFGFGGWVWGVLLVTFFVSASALSTFKKGAKAAVAEQFDKGSRRDLGQALANGGLGALLAVLSAVWPAPLWWWAFLGAMGTVNADTWATELGVLSRQQPRLITTGKIVPAGTSGGLTMLGTLAALGGGSLIGLVAWLLTDGGLSLVVVAGIGGLAGALIDSLLGATVQTIYRCAVCGQETERVECCQQPTSLQRGWGWLRNDWVNFISSIGGAGVAIGLGWWL